MSVPVRRGGGVTLRLPLVDTVKVRGHSGEQGYDPVATAEHQVLRRRGQGHSP